MRRLLAILAVFALVVAACGSKGDPGTAGPGTDIGTTEIVQECVPSDVYPEDEACANFADVSTEEDDEVVEESSLLQARGHVCRVLDDQVFVYPDVDANPETGFDPEALGLRRAEPADLQERAGLSAEEAQAVISYLDRDDIALGLYISDQGIAVLDLVDLIEDQTGGQVDGSPHYELLPTDPRWKYGPANKAQPIRGDWPLDRTGPSDDAGRVVIIDTGWIPNAPVDVGVKEDEDSGVDPRVAGHGLFAASVVEQFNPELTIDVYRATSTDEALNEASIIAALDRATPQNNDVVNMSLGTYPCEDDDPPLGMIQAISALPEGVQVAAASGNDGNNHVTMFPAALGFPGLAGSFPALEDNGIDFDDLAARVWAVGALDRQGNEPPWSSPAEVLAPGAGIVGYYHDPMGLAVWSGTSFATPHFAACLASGACPAP